MEANAENLVNTLEIARAEVIRLRPHVALEHLRTILRDVEDMPETSVWAEHQLIYAGALAATGDPASELEFERALERICNLATRNIELEMRAHEDFADFLVRFPRRPSLARQHYQSARQLAVERGLHEPSARLQLRIIKIDLESDQDPLVPSFRRFMKLSAELNCTDQERLQAWILYSGDSQKTKRGLRAARHGSMPSDEYFRGLLASVRQGER